MDFAQLGVDLTDGTYHGRVYVFSNAINGPWLPGLADGPSRPMRYSVDGGLHLSDRVMLPLARIPNAGSFPASVLVHPSGTVIAAYANRYTKDGGPYTGNNPLRTLIQIVRSTDGAPTVTAPTTV